MVTTARKEPYVTATQRGSAASQLSKRTSHFALPKQWESMRRAEAIERETGRRVIHLEKGDFQGSEFHPAPHITQASERAIRDGHVRPGRRDGCTRR
jgi:hypothetical protein